MSQRFFRLLVLFLVVIGHLLAFIQFRLQINTLTLPLEWRDQFLLLLTISLVVALSLNIFQSKIFSWLLLFFQSLFLIVITLPTGRYLGLELTLTTILVIEAFEYLTIWSGLSFSIILVGCMLGVKYLPITAWGQKMPMGSAHDLYSFGVYSGLIIVLSLIIRFQRNAEAPVSEIRKLYQDIFLQLSQVNIQLQEYAATVQEETLINERKRLTREIHDALAYTLTNLVMMLEAAKFMTKPNEKELQEHLERAGAQAKDGLTEVHRALQALQPAQLSEVTGLPAIQNLVAMFGKATQIDVSLELGNVPLNFGDEADLVAYRFVQEGITNALRHGRATKIVISLSLVGNKVHIQIRDNGVGADGIKEGYGLSGMRERIERLGGRLEVSGSSGFGFRLLAVIPI